MASCAVPGFMPPIKWGERILVDGGVVDAVPVAPAKIERAETVIAVDVAACLCKPCIVENRIDGMNCATEFMGLHLNRMSTEGAHVVIEPAVSQFEWTDFLNYEELIREREKAAEISGTTKLFGKVTVNNIYTDFFCALFCIIIFLT